MYDNSKLFKERDEYLMVFETRRIRNNKRLVIKTLFLVYLMFLFVFVVLKFNGDVTVMLSRIMSIKTNRMNGYWNYSLIPLASTRSALQNMGIYFIRDIVINIAIFLPCGFLIVAMSNKPLHKTLFLGGLISLAVELLQLVLCVGYFDIDDILIKGTSKNL